MRKHLSIPAFLFLLCILFSITSQASNAPSYIQKFKDIAIREMHRSGIPASITLAQAIHESAWGQGTLALRSNNYFGIKCKDYWTGPTYYIKDDDYVNGELVQSCFRAYESIEASFIDHSDFLRDNPRYKRLFTYDITDYKSWARGLQECTYATDPKYASKLIRTIEQYELYKFDTAPDPSKPEPQPIAPPRFHIPGHVSVPASTLVVPSHEVLPQPLIIEEEETEVPDVYVLPEDYQRGANLRKEVIAITEKPVEQNQPQRYPVEKESYQTEAIIRMTYSGNDKTAQLGRRPRVSSNQRR